ncbi:hypothetical protein AB0M35_15145 [Micromonospora sp. NPDC051196]|uniref:hypothetical protein n=1 Tax=Micromonospora sp. NPDC051196 TaxID=3155281 RepID=UPI00342700F1
MGDELGSGGQGAVFALPHTRSPSLVYKAYSEDVLADLDADVLTELVDLPSGLSAQDRRRLSMVAAWPRDLVTEGDRVCGFTMALVPQRFHTKIKLAEGHKEHLGQIQLLLNSPAYLTRIAGRIDDRFRLNLLADIAGTLRLFHRLGLTVGDLSPNNLLYSLTGEPLCHFIDCDAMQLHGRTALPQVETTDWEVPAGVGALGSKDSDTYKFALLCARLFAGDQSTTDLEALRRAGTGVLSLAQRSLAQDASDRPEFGDWEECLRAARPTPAEPPTTVTVPSAPLRVTVPPTPTRASVPSPPARTSRPHVVPVSTSPRRTRVQRRRLVKLVVLSLLLGYVVTHAPEIESVARRAAEAVFSNDAEARHQADEIAGLLASSAPVRTKVKGAVANLAACKKMKRSVADLGAASSARQRSLTAAKGLQVTELTDGATMKAQLISAFKHSKAADDAYRSWGLKLSKQGCRKSVRNGPDRKRGDKESVAATKAKQRFADLWNQVGPGYGHGQVSYQNI